MSNEYAGGQQTNVNGKAYEASVDLVNALTARGYEVVGSDVYDSCGQYVGVVSAQYDFYRMLADLGVDWQSICSKKYLPDDALLDERTSTLYIFEKKFQSTGGSVDEKIQTGPFKLYQYRKLADAAGIANVVYSYVLEAGYFSSAKFDDVREYYTDIFPEINMFYNEFGLDVLGLYGTIHYREPLLRRRLLVFVSVSARVLCGVPR